MFYALFISLINYFFLDKDKLKEIKDKQKSLQEQMKKHQKDGNSEKMMELQKEMFSGMGEMFKHSLKPMLITFVPILLFFSFLKGAYTETSIASSWFWYYLITALATSMIFRKILKLP